MSFSFECWGDEVGRDNMEVHMSREGMIVRVSARHGTSEEDLSNQVFLLNQRPSGFFFSKNPSKMHSSTRSERAITHLTKKSLSKTKKGLTK